MSEKLSAKYFLASYKKYTDLTDEQVAQLETIMEAYKNQFPQEVSDEEIYKESKKLGDFAMEAGFSSGAKWMRSKLTGK